MINNLPSELLYNIADFMEEGHAFLPLRLVSRRYNTIFTRFAFRSFNIRLGQNPPFGTVTAEEHWCSGNTRFQPIPDAFVNHITSLEVILLPLQSLEHLCGGPCTAFWGEILRLRALTELKIKCGNSYHGDMDSMTVINKILDQVHQATDGHLTHMTLYQSKRLTALPYTLTRFFGLKSLSIECSSTTQAGRDPGASLISVQEQLRSIIGKNSSLQSLAYHDGYKEPHLSLHSILPETLGIVNIQKLFISSPLSPALLCHNAPLLPHFSQLQHLELSYHFKSPPSNIDQLWDTLKNTGVRLKTIITKYISTALLEYLICFEGLRQLKLHLHPYITSDITHSLIYRAYSAHAATLEELELELEEPQFLPIECDNFILASPPQSQFQFSAFPKLGKLHLLGLYNPDMRIQYYSSLQNHFSQLPAIENVIIWWYDSQSIMAGGSPSRSWRQRKKISNFRCPPTRRISTDEIRSRISSTRAVFTLGQSTVQE